MDSNGIAFLSDKCVYNLFCLSWTQNSAADKTVMNYSDQKSMDSPVWPRYWNACVMCCFSVV